MSGSRILAGRDQVRNLFFRKDRPESIYIFSATAHGVSPMNNDKRVSHPGIFASDHHIPLPEEPKPNDGPPRTLDQMFEAAAAKAKAEKKT